jgi:hypothetical protein
MPRIAWVETIPAEADMLIIVGRELAAFYEFLKPRHEAKGRTTVLLDRRTGAADGTPPTALPIERRTPIPAAAAALLGVLGFMVLHRAGADWLA